MVENAIKEVYTALLPKTMIIADLGCSSGPNTLLFISTVISIIAEQSKSSGDDSVELQFFLNDLPGNDFNELFRSIEKFKRPDTRDERAHVPPLYYILGLPESYYNRLFPRESVHLFHSSYCLHWRSKVFGSLLKLVIYQCFVHIYLFLPCRIHLLVVLLICLQ